MSETKQLDVTIMGREFRVACPVDEEDALLEAVGFVDRKMREIRDSGNVMGIDKVAIMAALNIAHEFMNTRVTGGLDVADFRRRIGRMQQTVEDALKEQQQLF
ncbi:cell division protein ZapA [Chitinimonas koreensis]|uniref:cell division protein ZapA n=1 Tax=Chitinimonas koreensis TaxID=356302 RepID=UPI0004243BED|nr:cell division protein ZapA [Chitinimonas koreensis]QNM96629.1 cell division protein ZapA [Chitinimonas koreensis]